MTSRIIVKGVVYLPIRTAAKLTMYHGTCTGRNGEVLASILKEGLKPDPKVKAYKSPYSDDEDDYGDGLDFDTETSMRLNESLGGAYLTNKIGVALQYAKHACAEGGGQPMLVSARIETRTPDVKIDEDFLVNYSWDYITSHFEPKDPDSYHLELFDWLEGGADWNAIAKGWTTQQFPHAKISDHRWQQVLPKMGAMLQDIAIITFLQNHERDANNEAMDKDEDWDVDAFYEMQERVESYKDNIAFVTEKLNEIAEPPESGMHNVRSLKPVGYRGANRILAVASWKHLGGHNASPGSYAQVGKVYYALTPADAQNIVKAAHAKYSKWTNSTDAVIYDQKIPSQQQASTNVVKAVRYAGCLYKAKDA